MVLYDGDRIILTGETSVAFVRNAFSPDPDMIARREAFRPILERNKIEFRDGLIYAEVQDVSIKDEPNERLF